MPRREVNILSPTEYRGKVRAKLPIFIDNLCLELSTYNRLVFCFLRNQFSPQLETVIQEVSQVETFNLFVLDYRTSGGQRPVIVKLLRGFANLWLSIVCLLILGNTIHLWHFEPFVRVEEIYALNIEKIVTTIVAFIPGIVAYRLADRLQLRRERNAKQRQERDKSPTLGEVIEAYGRLLEKLAQWEEGTIVAVDETKLPAPKDHIKAAILWALRHTREPGMVASLKVGYIELCKFQPGIGNDPIVSNLPQIPKGATREDILRAAEVIASEDNDVALKWMKVVNREHEQLVRELKTAGFWEEVM